MNHPPVSEHTFDFCTATIYKDYVYVIMNEGITVVPAYNEILIKLANTYFKGINFVYITDRKNSYSVDPTIYLETAKIENLRAFIAVTPEPLERNPNHTVEKLFFNKPFQVFDDLAKALQYKDDLLCNL